MAGPGQMASDLVAESPGNRAEEDLIIDRDHPRRIDPPVLRHIALVMQHGPDALPPGAIGTEAGCRQGQP